MPPLITDNDATNEAHLIHQIARQLRVSFDRRVKHLGLTRSQWRALGMLRRHPGMSQSQLAERLEIEPITLVRLLDRMEKAGWIDRKPNPKDRRANCLMLTTQAQGILKKMRPIALSVRRDALKDFSKSDHAMLLAYLKRIKHNVSHMLGEEED